MSSPDLSLVLPAYNEERSIQSSLAILDRVVRNMELRYEIVVVDDGSTDNTREGASGYANRNGHVTVIGYDRNIGKGYAVKNGFAQTHGDLVVFVDSDLEIELGMISAYVKALRCGDIVIASKSHRESVVEMPLVRRALSYGFNVLVRLLTGIKLRDTQTGLKAMKRSAFKNIFPRLCIKRYAFDVELLTLASLYNLKVVEMPVKIRTNALFSVGEVWSMFMDLLRIAFRLKVLRLYQRSL
jgi:glycosyltransferase involved in cell wall biosynthesis